MACSCRDQVAGHGLLLDAEAMTLAPRPTSRTTSSVAAACDATRRLLSSYRSHDTPTL
jgi:hypothetical protein